MRTHTRVPNGVPIFDCGNENSSTDRKGEAVRCAKKQRQNLFRCAGGFTEYGLNAGLRAFLAVAAGNAHRADDLPVLHDGNRFNSAVSIAFGAEPSMAWDSIRFPPQSRTAIARVTWFFSAQAVQPSTRPRAPAELMILIVRVGDAAGAAQLSAVIVTANKAESENRQALEGASAGVDLLADSRSYRRE